MKARRVWSAAIALGLLLGACGPATQDAPTAAGAPVRVEVAAASERQERLAAFGTIEISPDHSRTISLSYDAVIVALRAASGQAVASGAPLIEVRPTPAVVLEQRRALEALRFAREDHARVTRLRAQSLATNADLAAAQQALAVAEATANDLDARIGAGGVRVIRAPIAGLVEALDVEAGAIVPAGAPLARVGDAQSLQARFGVEIEDLAAIAQGASTHVQDLRGEVSVEGRVARVLRRIDPTTRLAEATVTLPADASFLPGAPVRGEIAIGPPRTVITLPRAAIVYDGENAGVFVVQQNTARRIGVRTGAEFGDRIEIVSGLELGQEVIVEGGASLADGAAVTVEAPAAP